MNYFYIRRIADGRIDATRAVDDDDDDDDSITSWTGLADDWDVFADFHTICLKRVLGVLLG